MSDQWVVFTCAIEDQLAAIVVDLTWREGAVPSELNQVAACRIPLQDPGTHGCGTQVDSDRLNELERALVPLLPEGSCRFVGRVRSRGSADFYFYLAAECLDEFRAVATEQLGEEAKFMTREDSEWEIYHALLCPSDDELQRIKDQQTVDSLARHGDDGTASRRIDHWVHFPTEEARQTFLDRIDDQGFQVEGLSEDAEAEERAFGVQLYHEGPATLKEVHSKVMLLLEPARLLGGEYDGWETQVVAPAD